MSRTLRACFLSFPFRPAPSSRLSSVCLLNMFPRPLGRGMGLRLSICDCGHGGGLPARSYTVALSPPGSFAVSRSIAIGFACRRFFSFRPIE